MKTRKRIALALTLTLALATTPSAFAAGRGGREFPPAVKIVKNLLRWIGVTITAEPSLPIPPPRG